MKSLIYGYDKTGKSFERYLKKNNQLDFKIYDSNILKFNRKYDLNMWFARTDTVTPETLKRLKGVGVNWVAYGFESFNVDTLTSINKRIKNFME